MSPDSKAAVEFLRRFEPEGPWVLTAITPDRKAPIVTNTFWSSDIDELRAWLGQYNGKRNLYYHVNRPLRDLTKKAEREDIKEVAWLHVDIDPRAGEDIEEERERTLGLLTDRLPKGVPPPTVIVFSGGGHQALWRLAAPIQINGDLALAEDAKRYNQQLEVLFGADNCHNIDRIMRLPGTINIPDASKQKKGRKKAQAHVVRFEDHVYPIAHFTPAPAVQAPDATVKISGNAERIADLAALDAWSVPDRVKVIINQGTHPDEKKEGDDSRSAWLFDALCSLVRCEVPDETIYSIITDPGWSISKSVVDKGANAEKYAIRQIERAKEQAINPWLRELNERHFVLLNDGGKCRVAEWVPSDGDGREVLTYQSFDDFRNRYLNQQVQVGTTPQGLPLMKPVGKFWLEHPMRQQYDGLVFRPGREQVINGYWNLWRDFAVVPAPGDWSLMRAHIREVLASGDETSAEYILKWSAWAVQHPGEPAEVALVFRGGRGTGKGLFARALKSMFGQHGLQVTSPMQLTGRFNAHLRDCCLLFADEAIVPGDKAAESVLKGLITEPELTIEGKGVNTVQARNHLHVVMVSNDDWVVPAGMDERRFAVFEVSGHRAGAEGYFATLGQQLEAGGAAAMLHDLLAMDLGSWHPRRDVPKTGALLKQKELSLSPMDQFLLGVLEAGDISCARLRTATFLSNDTTQASGLYTIMRRSSPRLRDMSDQKLSAALKDWGCARYTSGRVRGWKFPPLSEMRAAWNKRFGPREWSEPTDWEEVYDEGPF